MAEQKATRNFERFYIPQREHSKLIGRGGETLKGIEKRLSVRIRIPNRDEKSDLVTVQSVSQEDAAKVLKAVKDEFEDILDFPISTSPLLTIKLDIPAGKYGALIGAKGATLKEIQAKSGAVLNIPKKEEQTPDAKVAAIGSKSALQKLVSEVSSILGFRPHVIGEAIDSEEARAKQPKLDLVSNPINEALFFPERPDSDEILNRMLHYLRSANKSIEVAVYNMTDDRIARALEEQHQAGIQVRIITHYSTMVDPGSDIHTMAAIGAQVKVDVTPQLMHHKFALIDDQVLLNGSFNWTRSAAEGNAENVIITNQPDLVKAFSAHFDKMWADNDRLQVLPPHGSVTPKDPKAKAFAHSD